MDVNIMSGNNSTVVINTYIFGTYWSQHTGFLVQVRLWHCTPQWQLKYDKLKYATCTVFRTGGGFKLQCPTCGTLCPHLMRFNDSKHFYKGPKNLFTWAVHQQLLLALLCITRLWYILSHTWNVNIAWVSLKIVSISVAKVVDFS